MTLVRSLALAAVAALGTGGLSLAAQTVDPATAQVDRIIRAWVPPHGPGAAVLVLQNGNIAFQGYYGQASAAKGTRIGPETRFLLGSVSKQFTALAVMILAERHVLSYDDPLRKFFPDFPPYADSISVRQLLHHLGGLPEYEQLFVSLGKVDSAWPRSAATKASSYEPTAADARRLLAEHARPGFPSGDRFEYSNSGYMLLAQIVEQATGERFATFMRREVFEPLGMSSSVLLDETTPPIPNRAQSYQKTKTGFRDIDYTPFNHIYGEDNVVATLADVGRWVRGLDSARLVTRPSLDLAYTSGRTQAGRATGYGFGWMLGRSLGVRVVSHGGSWVGFRTVIRRYPEQGLAVVALANWAESDPEPIAARIAAVYLGSALTTRVAVPVSREVIARSLGTYLIRGRFPIVVRERGKQIRLETPFGSDRIEFDSDSTAFVSDNPAMGVTFRTDSLVYHRLESNETATRKESKGR